MPREFDEDELNPKNKGPEKEDELEIEIIDDTPEADRGRKPLESDPLAKKPEPDDEAMAVSKGVQKRLNELTRKAHDERRAREKAEREKEEAVRFASAQFQRTRMLENQLVNGESAFSNTTVEKEQLALETAEADYRKAFDAGDPDAMAKATGKVAAAAQRLENAKHWAAQAKTKQTALQEQKPDVDSQQREERTQPQTQELDVETPHSSAVEWAEKNPWFGKNRKMTSYVYGIHEELTLEQGLHPVENAEEYYAAINKEMRERFPDFEWDSDEDTGNKPPASKSDTTAKPKAKTATSVVAPVTRTSSGNGRKVLLTASEARVAESLGISPEAYAREKLKLESQG